MGEDRLSKLTPRQRECLRLVALNWSSKEIAAKLGDISHHTVDLHLKRATKQLGVSSRREAARLLLASEGKPAEDIQTLGTQTPNLAGMGGNGSFLVQEAGPRFRVPFLRQGKQHNDLGALQRLGWIGVLSIVMMLTVANVLNAMSALYKLGE